MITVKDFQKATEFPRACKDEGGRLRVGAAVGTTPDTLDRVTALREAGVDVIVLDTSHGHSRGVLEMITRLKARWPVWNSCRQYSSRAKAHSIWSPRARMRSRWA